MRDWPRPPLGSLVETIVPARDKPEELDGPIPWVRIEDFDGKWIDGSRSGQGVSPQTVARMNLRVFPAGTVACTCSCNMGTTAIVQRPLITNQTFIGLRPRSEALIPEFLYYSLAAHRDQLNAQSTGAIQSYLSRDDFRQLRLPIPSPIEQRTIAAYLDYETSRIDALVAKKTRLANLARSRFESQVSRALWAVGAPTIRLKHLCGVPSSGNRDHQSFVEGSNGIPCLRGLNVRPGRIQRDGLLYIDQAAHARQRATQLRVGDVVIVRSGLAGAAAAIPRELDGANCVDLVIVRRSPEVIPAWLEYALNSREAQEQVARRQAGAILTHFNAVDAGEVRLPRVPMQEQQEVVEALDAAKSARDALVERLARQTALLREHRQALIMAAVTGELEIPGVA